jgi:acyl-CoA thioester hydrolase
VKHPSDESPRKRVHSARIDVRWSDMDLNRHVNNVVYFRYFEQARIEWFDRAFDYTRRRDHGIVIANAYCTYRKALAYPGTVEVALFVGPAGRTSFTFHYDLHAAGDPATRYADGYTRVVWVDRNSGRPEPLPDYVRALLA